MYDEYRKGEGVKTMEYSEIGRVQFDSEAQAIAWVHEHYPNETIWGHDPIRIDPAGRVYALNFVPKTQKYFWIELTRRDH